MSSGTRSAGRLPIYRRYLILGIAFAAALALGVLTNVSRAAAATPAPGWSITSQAEPTYFNFADTDDQYTITAVNVGGSATEGEVTITDLLPVQLLPIEAEIIRSGSNAVPPREGGACTLGARVQCTFNEPVLPEEDLSMRIKVALQSGAPEAIDNQATVSGSGRTASTTETTEVNRGSAAFGVSQFGFEADGLDGLPDEQAGDHPFAVRTTIHLNTVRRTDGETPQIVAQDVKNVSVTLPAGFYGDPLVAAQCHETDLTRGGGFPISPETGANYHALCPPGSQVGTVRLIKEGDPTRGGEGRVLDEGPFPLYNLVPEPGYPAELGFNAGLSQPIFLYASVVPSAAGYRLRISTPGALRAVYVEGLAVTIFGSPGERSVGGGSAAFVTNPTACSSTALPANLEATSWEGGSATVEATAYPAVTGCSLLQGVSGFDPSIRVDPETTQSDTPSGYQIDLKLPQAPDSFGTPTTPELKNATVTLPPGVSVSPGSATGLGACTPQQINLLGTEIGEGHPGGDGSPYDDGLTHASPGSCPESSRLAAVQIQTPVLEAPLEGHIFLAQPQCGGSGQLACTEAAAEEGKVFGLYLEAAGSGVIVKLAGSVEAGGYGPHSAATGLAPGQLRARFDENPQLPFEDLKLTFPGGPRATLANPQGCEIATTTSEFEPWSAPESGPNATPLSSFEVTGCANPAAFTPGFQAGTVTPTAGGFSPFTLTFSRHDREQDFSGITVRTPPGLLGKLSSVPRCGEPQAAQGTCPQASEIGTTTVASGAGSQPLYIGGHVFLTGPYKGEPFGLSIVVPAVAGPFNLGNVIVRSSIHIDPSTSALTITSDPLPQTVDGVPLRIQTVNVNVNRPGFIFNPTNCVEQQIAGTITSAQGANSSVSSPFAVTGCANLPFKPKFTALTEGRASKAGGAYLHVKVVPGPGQANIGKVKVDLPKQLPSRLTTLQKACLASVFDVNPAACPAASAVGQATAITPLLNNPLKGPAYLVSHGGAAFPDLEIVLQGEGITLILDGNTDIKKGITSSTFKSVPDAPISSFDLVLPTGPHSVLGTNVPLGARYSLCGLALAMPTAITGQNGAVVKQTTKIAVGGCSKSKKTRRKTKTKDKKSI
jgi:hypothetical protein